MLHKKLQVITCVILSLLFYFSNATAGTSGRLKGKVIDKNTQEPIRNVRVKIEGTVFESATDKNGEFFFIAVEPGVYQLTASLGSSIVGHLNEVLILPDQVTDAVVIGHAGGEPEQLQSAGFVVPINPFSSRHTSSRTLTLMTGRTVSDIIQNTDVSWYTRGASRHVRAGEDYEIGYFLNGMQMNDPFTGDVFSTIPYTAIDQLIFNSSGYTANYGAFSSGMIQIIPKKGTNKVHVTAESVTDAVAPILKAQSYGRRIYNIALNGPIIRDKLVFFSAAEFQTTDDANPGVFGHPRFSLSPDGRRNTDPAVMDSVVFKTDQRGRLKFAQGARPNGVNKQRTVNWYSNLSLVQSKQFQMGIMGLYSFDQRNIFQNNMLLSPSRVPHSERHTWSGQISGAYTITPNVYWQGSAGLYTTNSHTIQRDVFNQGDDAVLTLSQYYLGNTMSSSYYGDNLIYDIDRGSMAFQKSETKVYSAATSLTWRKNREYLVRTGFRTSFHSIRYFDLTDPFNLVNGSNNYYGYRIESSPGHLALRHENAGPDGVKRPVTGFWFVEDEISIRNVTVTRAIRWDYFDNGTKELKDWSNPTGDNMMLGPEDFTNAKAFSKLSPRVGLTAVITDQITVRSNFGLYYQIPPLSRYYVRTDVLERQSINPINNIALENPNLRLQETESINLELNYRIDTQLFLSLTGYRKGITNPVGIGTIASSPNGFQIFGNYHHATVYGLELELQGQVSKNVSGGVEASLMDAERAGLLEESSGFREAWLGISPTSAVATMDHELDQSLRLHVLGRLYRHEGPGIYGSYPFENMSFFVAGRLQNGFPYTPTAIGPTTLQGVYNHRIIARKNSKKSDPTISIDLKILKEFVFADRYEVFWYLEVQNVLNRKNTVNVFTSTGNGNDDGFLSTQAATSWGSRQLLQYQYILKDNSHYSNPRLVAMGLKVGF